MKNKTTINDVSIDTAGLPKDYMEAVAELIWNGYDARAKNIELNFETNAIDIIYQLNIVDNGDGIDLSTLHETFGAFLDSKKRNLSKRSSYIRGKRGKGRFSFATFSGKATWHTVYLSENKLLEYDIIINQNDKDYYEDINYKISNSNQTGTVLKLEELFGVSGYSFSSREFKEYLAKEFGWFLLLNKTSEFSLKINGEAVVFDHLVEEQEKHQIEIKGSERTFDFGLTYVRWREKIGDKYYFYFLDSEQKEVAKVLTSYNNNAADFHHSIYIQSTYFNDFHYNESDGNTEMFGKNQNDIIFKNLAKDLDTYLFQKQKDYIRKTGANDLVEKLVQKGVFPKFSSNKYDMERRNDLIDVVKELYAIQPKIFKNLKPEQEITFLGFLNLLLDSDERENILSIIENVVSLKKEEREELTLLLKRTNFSKIVNTIKLIENRYKVTALLKKFVFDLKQFTTERDHIQGAIEENYWLFGEQYHLVSADVNFEKLLSNYLYIIDGVEAKQKIDSYEKNRRPDIFMCRKRNVPDTLDHEYELEENIMVELKRPTVTVTKKEFRQIDDYLDFILKNDKFNSQLRRWKFYVISNKVDSYIEKQYEAFKDKGKRFLVQQAGKYEIYALTWDDLFRTFEIKHNYLLEKLNFDKSALQEELNLKGVYLNGKPSDKISQKLSTTKKRK